MKFRLKFLRSAAFFAALLLLLNVAVRADAVDDFVRAQLAEHHIPGAAIVVVKNGKTIKSAGYGLASVEFNIPAAPETEFEIGSVSKQFTAAGIMLLVEDGKINLDEKISKYLPNTPDSWGKITVRNLLTHTSGIKSYSSIDGGFELYRNLKRDDFIKKLSAYPLDFETGTSYVYSNSGYSLLAYIIESASGKAYWDFMNARIFTPLKMTRTFDRDPKNIIPNRAGGYEWTDSKLVGRDYNLTALFGAGTIVSTVTDLAKWDAALRNDTLLKKDSKLQMWTPLTFNDGKNYPYGFGFSIREIRGHKLIAHSGQTAGFGANISRYVDDDVTVIALTNLGESGMGTLLTNGIARLVIPAISLKAMTALPETNAKTSATIQTALRDVLQNKFDANILNADLIKSLSTERSKANNQRLAAFGAIKTLTLVGSETNGVTKIYRYRMELPSKILLWRVGVNADGKISEMTLEEEE